MNLARRAWSFASTRWSRFFFMPADPRLCAFLRIAYALLLLINEFMWWDFLEMWFGAEGAVPPSVARELNREHVLSLFDLAPSWPHTHVLLFTLITVHTLLLLAGCWSRLQALAVFVYVASFQHRNSVILDGEDILFRLFPFFLMFLPIGELWSVDAWWRRRKGVVALRQHPKWPLRFIQIEWSVIMLSSAGYKLLGESWRDGTALYYVSRLEDFFGRFWLPAAPFESLVVLKVLTWLVVATELVIPVAIWWPRTRRASLVLAICLHLGIDYTMNLCMFQWLMILGWLTFLEPRDIDALAAFSRAIRRRLISLPQQGASDATSSANGRSAAELSGSLPTREPRESATSPPDPYATR